MDIPSYFTDFIANIRLSQAQTDDLKNGWRELRKRLEADADVSQLFVSTFLQGSYRRSTAIKPQGDQRSDVDVVVVTTLDKNKVSPAEAFAKFTPFMEKHYKGKYRKQGRSFGIELSYVSLDLVLTASPLVATENSILKAASITADTALGEDVEWRLNTAWLPSSLSINRQQMIKEAAGTQEWKLSPLYIPDRDSQRWERTHPLAQLAWTAAKNRRCNSLYLDVVKAAKWWRREMQPLPKHPKGYPVEHLVGLCCPNGIESIAAGLSGAFQSIVTNYMSYAAAKQTPHVPDHGVPEHNVLGRVSGEDFAAFYENVKRAADIARKALDAATVKESAVLWRGLLGDEFPKPPDDGNDGGEGPESPKGGYTPRKDISILGGGRFARE